MMSPATETEAASEGGAHESSGAVQSVIGGVLMLVAVGFFVYAFQSALTDEPHTAAAWLIAAALALVGVFTWGNGMRKQRVAWEIAEQQKNAEKLQSDAETVAAAAIERARKK